MPTAHLTLQRVKLAAACKDSSVLPGSDSMACTPKDDIEVLSQEIHDDIGLYRVRAGQRVYYLTIPTTTFDDDTMCRPYLLVPQLPEFPTSAWTNMLVTRDEDARPKATLSTEPMPEIQAVWHPRFVDILSLVRVERLRSCVYGVLFEGEPAVCKFACFDWHMPRIEHETWAYSVLSRHQAVVDSAIAPRFLAHVVENGRVIGFLLEKLPGEPACLGDRPRCEAVLRRLHGAGLVHGDVNRFNFVVDRSDGDRSDGGSVRLVDFEHAQVFDKDLARTELQSLPSELAEETGRGESRALAVVDARARMA